MLIELLEKEQFDHSTVSKGNVYLCKAEQSEIEVF